MTTVGADIAVRDVWFGRTWRVFAARVVSSAPEAERVVAAWPFPTGWEDFRPDAGLPRLPDDCPG